MGIEDLKSSFPASRKIVVRMVDSRRYPRALRLAARNRPFRGSRKPAIPASVVRAAVICEILRRRSWRCTVKVPPFGTGVCCED